tara:strand:+ start:2109 stop:3119 length:1011 start_codon:yes stop_codon:yes gene_type:complete
MIKKNIKIVAEAGCNHNGKIKLAYKLIDKAKQANVDAIKFQLFTADETVTKSAKKAQYARAVTKINQSQYDMQKSLELTEKEHLKLHKYCKKKGIEYLCSAFDLPSLDFLKRLKIKEFKIPSGEIINYPYLKKLASFNKKVILSTGMATVNEISDTLKFLKKNGLNKKKITLLHCNSEYPTPYSDTNLKAMIFLNKKFRLPVGISDHTLGIEVPIAAAALGAVFIEKHFTLDRKMVGPDHQASITPLELKKMVTAIRNIEKALGKYEKKVTRSEKKNINIARKSIVAIKSIKKGEVFSPQNIGVKRPGTGISPTKFFKYIGKKAEKNYKFDQLIQD